jgi:hypothetical protein
MSPSLSFRNPGVLKTQPLQPGRIHLTETTKNALPPNTYETSKRGFLKISEGFELPTYLIEGKTGKSGGKTVKFSNAIDENEEVKVGVGKWEGFRLVK